MLQAQLQLRKASSSFLPAEGPPPTDVPGQARGRGRGKGRGRGRKSGVKEVKHDDHDEASDNEGHDAEGESDLEAEDQELQEELEKESLDKDRTPSKKPVKRKRKTSAKKGEADPETAGTPKKNKVKTPKRKRRTPKLKRALASARDGNKVFCMHTVVLRLKLWVPMPLKSSNIKIRQSFS